MTLGTSFSGCCLGPKFLVHLVTITGVPYVLWLKVQQGQVALLELYGDEGFKCEFSEKESWSVEPYTSSVLMCMKRETPTFLDASSKTWVPRTLLTMNSYPDSMDRSTCDSAAKWITHSGLKFSNISMTLA